MAQGPTEGDIAGGESLEEDAKRILLQELRGCLKLCREGGEDPTYLGQDQPLSWHLDRLIKALETSDLATIVQYRRGEGSWFPYHNIVETYFETIKE